MQAVSGQELAERLYANDLMWQERLAQQQQQFQQQQQQMLEQLRQQYDQQLQQQLASATSMLQERAVTQAKAAEKLWEGRLEQLKCEEQQRTEELMRDRDRLRSKCSDLMMKTSMAQAEFASDLKEFLMRHHNHASFSVPLLLHWLQQKTCGIVQPDDGPLPAPGAPAPPPPPPARMPTSSAGGNRKRGRSGQEESALLLRMIPRFAHKRDISALGDSLLVEGLVQRRCCGTESGDVAATPVLPLVKRC
eukprot:TRINITY_DN39760_c0_g1_i1.p1 TRINITY_DN39760_c0_g1~~TRINITY_DN39760_c0_g1_i1.p1  ORF type:complete len:277 (+),score=139.52 TRINITY_DN39760_c0_g1_i1:85-831(+)